MEQSLQTPWSLNQWADELQVKGAVCLLAELAGSVIGIAAFRHLGQEAELMRVAVCRSKQQVGVGRQLLVNGFNRLVTRSVQACFLEVCSSNLAGQALYRSLGFKKIGLRPGYYRKPSEDAIIMQLDLSKSEAR